VKHSGLVFQRYPLNCAEGVLQMQAKLDVLSKQTTSVMLSTANALEWLHSDRAQDAQALMTGLKSPFTCLPWLSSVQSLVASLAKNTQGKDGLLKCQACLGVSRGRRFWLNFWNTAQKRMACYEKRWYSNQETRCISCCWHARLRSSLFLPPSR
jgi:hypothetical protein